MSQPILAPKANCVQKSVKKGRFGPAKHKNYRYFVDDEIHLRYKRVLLCRRYTRLSLQTTYAGCAYVFASGPTQAEPYGAVE